MIEINVTLSTNNIYLLVRHSRRFFVAEMLSNEREKHLLMFLLQDQLVESRRTIFGPFGTAGFDLSPFILSVFSFILPLIVVSEVREVEFS